MRSSDVGSTNPVNMSCLAMTFLREVKSANFGSVN